MCALYIIKALCVYVELIMFSFHVLKKTAFTTDYFEYENTGKKLKKKAKNRILKIKND